MSPQPLTASVRPSGAGLRNITLGREFATGSGAIGRLLAERLHWNLYDPELIDEIAHVDRLSSEQNNNPETRVAGWMERIGKSLWNAAGEKGPAMIPEPLVDTDRLAELSRHSIEQIASMGSAVILGRGGNYILHGRGDAFHVFLYAPIHWRIRRLEGFGYSRDQAEAHILRIDQERVDYIRRHFDSDWPRRQLYHLMVNSSLGAERSVDAILAAAGMPM